MYHQFWLDCIFLACKSYSRVFMKTLKKKYTLLLVHISKKTVMLYSWASQTQFSCDPDQMTPSLMVANLLHRATIMGKIEERKAGFVKHGKMYFSRYISICIQIYFQITQREYREQNKKYTGLWLFSNESNISPVLLGEPPNKKHRYKNIGPLGGGGVRQSHYFSPNFWPKSSVLYGIFVIIEL